MSYFLLLSSKLVVSFNFSSISRPYWISLLSSLYSSSSRLFWLLKLLLFSLQESLLLGITLYISLKSFLIFWILTFKILLLCFFCSGLLSMYFTSSFSSCGWASELSSVSRKCLSSKCKSMLSLLRFLDLPKLSITFCWFNPRKYSSLSNLFPCQNAFAKTSELLDCLSTFESLPALIS